MSQQGEANTKLPEGKLLDNVVAFWVERLGAVPEPGAGDEKRAKRDARLAAQLRPMLRVLYQGSQADSPQTCPFSDRQSLRRILGKLDLIAGADPERINDLLLRVIDHGERYLGWVLPEAVATQLRLPRELPLITAEDMLGRAGLARLREALADSFVAFAALDPEARAGQLLYSAIVHGALLRRDLQDGLLLGRRGDLAVTPHGTWLAIPVAGEGQTDGTGEEGAAVRERWLVRPETELLLLRYWQDHPEEPSCQRKPWAVLSAYFKAAGVSAPLRPRSLAELNRWARAWHALTLPPFLRETMSGRLRSQGLNDAVHRRFCTGERVWQANRETTRQVKRVDTAGTAHPSPANRVPASEESKCLAGIFRILSRQDHSRADKCEVIARRLVSESAHLGKVGWLIGQWCVWLLGTGKKRLRLSAIRRYVNPVKRYVLAQFATADAAGLADDQWAARLQAAIDQSNDRLAPYAIYQFARFAVAQPDGPNIDPDELEGVESATAVGANLISVRHFEAAMDRLSCATERDTRMARLIGALGFYCGLRRSEALNLLIGDISGVQTPWLLLRSNRHRALKRAASQRALPLSALLPDSWRKELHAWIRRRDVEGRSRSKERLLCCVAGQDYEPVPGAELITPVRDALRVVTGDHTLVYHHLRHSFCCWTLVRLLSVELPLGAWQTQFAALADPWFGAKACRQLRSAVLGKGIRHEPVRHAAYALARLMGHAEVATTIRHYVHLADLLALGYQIHQRPLQLAEEQVRALLGLGLPRGTADAAYRRWRRLRNGAWDAGIGGLRAEPILKAARVDTLGYDNQWGSAGDKSPALQTDETAPAERHMCLDDVPAVLSAVSNERIAVEQVAEELRLPVDEVRRAKAAVCELAGQRTKDGRRHRFRLPPRSPSGEADGDAWTRGLRHAATSAMDMEAIRGGIDLLKRADPHRGHRVVLSRDDDALRYVAMLAACGFRRSALRIDLYPRQPDATANRTHWSSLLGVIPAQVAVKPFKHVGPGAPNGEIAIHVAGERQYSRLKAGETLVRPYDPQQAKRGLELVSSAAAAIPGSWQVSDASAVDDLAALLGWLGVPADRIAMDATAGRLTLAMESNLGSEVAARGLAALAGAMPHHDLRVVSRDEESIIAVTQLLIAWGVSPDLIRIDQTGNWEPLECATSAGRLVIGTGIKREHILPKRRAQQPPRLGLIVHVDRGHESIKSWSLTYTLIMLYVLAQALAPDPPVGPL